MDPSMWTQFIQAAQQQVGLLASSFFDMQASLRQANATLEQGQFQKQQLLFNEQIAERQARDELDKGQFEASRMGERTSQTVGSQRATLAAQGLDVNTGSAADIQRETGTLGSQDLAMIQHNAALSAWGYKVKAENFKSEAAWTELASRNEAVNTLFEGEAGFFKDSMKVGQNIDNNMSSSVVGGLFS